MCLDYYLLCRTKYKNIIFKLKDIIENYDDIFLRTIDLDINENIIKFDKHIEYKEQILSQLNSMIRLKDMCELKIKILCNHEFVNDMIDISPDRTQNIIYCKICEYTMPN